MRIYIWLLYASSGHTKHWDGGVEDIDMNIYICIEYMRIYNISYMAIICKLRTYQALGWRGGGGSQGAALVHRFNFKGCVT